MPIPPPGLSRRELKRWHKMQRKWGAMAVKAEAKRMKRDFDQRPLADRVIAFRGSAVRFLVLSPMFFVANAAMEGVPWFVVPVTLLFFDTLRKGGSIWSDGVGPIEAFGKGIRNRLRGAPGATAGTPPAPLPAGPPIQTTSPDPAPFAPREVLGGRYGDVVRQAAADRAIVRDIVGNLRPLERDMIPDVTPTVDALAQRVGGLATTLHRLDGDVSGASLGNLDERIASLSSETATVERDRRLSLLQRQRASLHDLLERRRSLANQLESASIALQNLKLDLLKLRSTGITSALEDVTSATQEARALSRDIAHVLEAADDLRRL
jgi:serine/threonine-protein kinase